MKSKNRKRPQNVVKIEESDSDSNLGEDMLEMIDEDDLSYLRTNITSDSYRNLYNKVKGVSEPKRKKRKLQAEESIENQYEDNYEDETVPMKAMLPIKVKRGIVRQQRVVDNLTDKQPEEEGHALQQPEPEDESADEFADNNDEFAYVEGGIDTSKPISPAQLLLARSQMLQEKKIHIGTLSAGLLENPEEKTTNLRTLLSLMDEETTEAYYTIRKLVMVSMLEVFKDILPSYEIKNTTTEGVKLKKDTLKLQRHEQSLVLYYKKYLQKLEKISSILIKKKGDTKKYTDEDFKLAEIAVHAMCELLVTHPYFNFGPNIAQAVVPFLNNSRKNIREIVKIAFKRLFKEDKKEEITLKVLRLVNNYLKSHAHNVNTDMLEILLVLNLRDVNLDQEKENDKAQKKLKAKKMKVLQMSRKEKKKKKRLEYIEKEMLETRAEENRQAKLHNLTEITKIVFGIYFRILKSSTNTKVLGVCLEGLAKFAHCINIEFYIDLVNTLDRLLKEDWIGYREQLHCIQTVFSILSGQGEALNVDPTRFYIALYKDLLKSNASKNHDNFLIVLRILNDALIKRRKKITNKRAAGFIKRLATSSLQLLHNGSLASLSLIRTAIQLNRGLDILLDLDSTVGDGNFNPEVDDPEYANASSTTLTELVLLSKHYHPVVRKYAINIAHGMPVSGDGSLPPDYAKCTAEELFKDFDMSEMAFNPPVPVPKEVTPKAKKGQHQFVNSSFESYCKDLVKDI